MERKRQGVYGDRQCQNNIKQCRNHGGKVNSLMLSVVVFTLSSLKKNPFSLCCSARCFHKEAAIKAGL